MKNSIFIILFLCSVCLGYSSSITSYNTGQITPLLEGRSDFQKYNSASRTLENVFVYAEGPVTRRPGTRYISQVPSEITGFTPPEAKYNWSFWFPEWAVAAVGLKVIYGLDGIEVEVGDINNIGGNLWGVPAIGHPLLSGQRVQLRGISAAFDNAYRTVHASTTANEVVLTIAGDQSGITFDGTERLILSQDMTPVETMLTVARMDTDGTYVYIPCYEETTYDSCVMRWDANTVTLDTTWKVNPTGGWGGAPNYGKSVFVVDDNTNIIIVSDSRITKASIEDGTVEWQVVGHGGWRYSPSCIIGDVIYITPSSYDVKMYSAVDGSSLGNINAISAHHVTDIVGSAEYERLVGCKQYGPAAPIGWPEAEQDCDVIIWDTSDNSLVKRLAVSGGTDGHLALWADIYQGNIYVTHYATVAEGYNLTKIDMNGNILAQAAIPFITASHYWRFDDKICAVKNATYEVGDYNAVVVLEASDLTTDANYASGEMLNTGYLYSTGGTLWTKKHPLSLMLVDGVYRDVQWVDEQIAAFDITDADETVRLIPFEYSTDDAYVLGFGDGYMGFFRTIE